MAFVDAIYAFVEAFPNTAKYGLRPQITRSAISIPSNIAKGASRNSEKDFARFLEIALGSAIIWKCVAKHDAWNINRSWCGAIS